MMPPPFIQAARRLDLPGRPFCFLVWPFYRIFYGRPFIFNVTRMFCFLWKHAWDERNKPYVELILFALWQQQHGFTELVPIVTAISFPYLPRKNGVFALMGLSTFFGIIIRALMTGQPYAFLNQMLFHALEAFGQHDFTHSSW